jgi:hypothetical protein
MDRNAAARRVFAFLDLSDDAPPEADLIIGFGHFDPRIPRRCCDVFNAGVAPRILFTGGRGAGTADIVVSEAEYFREEARRYAPSIPDSAFVLEATSTNTSENLLNSIQALESAEPPLRVGASLRRAILVATPYRQHRVWLTCRKLMPGVTLANLPPFSTYEGDAALFAGRGQDLEGLLPGEVERIVKYAEMGYVERATIPAEVAEACRVLRRSREPE